MDVGGKYAKGVTRGLIRSGTRLLLFVFPLSPSLGPAGYLAMGEQNEEPNDCQAGFPSVCSGFICGHFVGIISVTSLLAVERVPRPK